MSTNNTSTVTRRRKSNNKTKLAESTATAILDGRNSISTTTTIRTAAAAARISTSFTTPTSIAASENAQIQMTALTSPSASHNERLQRNLLSNKLDAFIQQNQTIATTNSQLFNSNSLTTLLKCCRDINCRLNMPNIDNTRQRNRLGNSQDRDKRSTSKTPSCCSTSQYSFTTNTNNSSRSASVASLPATYNATTCINATAMNCSNPTSLSSPQQIRDGSPDSGVSSDNSPLQTTAFFPLDATKFTINLHLDLFSWFLFVLALITRFYKLTTPPYVVFDESHYSHYISLYLRNIFFVDRHPPLGKQLIAAVTYMTGFDGNMTHPHIGDQYPPNVPIFWLRFLPALCGSILPSAVYKLLLETQMNRWSAFLGGLLIVFDNALLTQSRFVLMESMLLLFSTLGLHFLLKFQHYRFGQPMWLFYGLAAASFLTFACCIKYIGFLTGCLAAYLMCRHLWNLLYDTRISDFQIVLQTIGRIILFTIVPLALYVGIFYIHLQHLYRAGPHDSAMTSAFQASLDGGLASIIRGQPKIVVHGSQITLRNTYGRTCWLHSHTHLYPVLYADKRGSSHQQQVTCYSFKDVNNWWIVKRPNRENLVVGDKQDAIRHGDVIQLVHGITSRALNSHDVAAPMTPQCQEVSCYIDYEIKMPGELLWRVEILNKDSEGPIWHAVNSEIRLIHESTGAALRFSGRQLPDWGFNQHEVVADRITDHRDAIWNVEEHRYTKTQNQRERELQMLKAEMIPTKKTKLLFWEKFLELQAKIFGNSNQLQSHMYSSEPLEWPLLDKGIAYWMDSKSNSQIHLLGNIIIWYTGTLSIFLYGALLVFYIIRRRRLCYDLPTLEWKRFQFAGDIFLVGYLMHYVPFFLADHILFLQHYLPALLFKMYLLCFTIEHVDYLLRRYCDHKLWLVRSYRLGILLWIFAVLWIFFKYLPLSYGSGNLTTDDIIRLRWKETWDFIVHRKLE